MWRRIINSLCIAAALIAAAPAHAAFNDELQALQQSWAVARYQTKIGARKAQLKKLVSEADAFIKKYPNKADGYLWAAVIRGSLAQAINGLSALGIVKEARKDLEKAIAIDPKAEDGYAYGVLGLMYSRVPGWPIAFGSDKKARETLKKGLALNPDGMNINYFYAQYLFDNDDYRKALTYARKAEQAVPPIPPARSLAVANREREIHDFIGRIEAKLK